MQLLNYCYHRLLLVMVSRESFGSFYSSPTPDLTKFLHACFPTSQHEVVSTLKARISRSFDNFVTKKQNSTPWNKLKLYCKALVRSTGRSENTENIPLRNKRLDELNDDQLIE